MSKNIRSRIGRDVDPYRAEFSFGADGTLPTVAAGLRHVNLQADILREKTVDYTTAFTVWSDGDALSCGKSCDDVRKIGEQAVHGEIVDEKAEQRIEIAKIGR